MEQARERTQQYQEEFLREFRQIELSPVGRLLFEMIRNQFSIINRLDTAIEQNGKIMQDINALNAQIAQVITDETAGFSTVIKEVTDFLATQPGGQDFTTQITSLQQVDADVLALPGKVQAALAPVATGGTTTTGDGSAPQASAARKVV